MPGNTIGNIFRVTTWGESHGKALGAVIDGCPPGVSLAEKEIQIELDRRKPFGKGVITTTRKEKDKVEILSGVFDGKTTGMPISMIVWNKNARSKDYSNLKNIYRPGHADFTYFHKYGIRDYRGGGRSSGRETVARVMAGAVAKKILSSYKVKIVGHTVQIGPHKASKLVLKDIEKNLIRCADMAAAKEMIKYVEKVRREKDSVGGVVEIIVKNTPIGLGDPVFDKLDADLSKALFSIGAVKGVSFGTGFEVAEMKGSENNDPFPLKTNNAGGVLGGISNGEDIRIHIAVKPPASIGKKQKTINSRGREVNLEIKGRHDACIVPRLIPVAESMVAITLLDHLLMRKAIS